MSNELYEDFGRLAGMKRAEVTMEDVDQVRAALKNTLESNGTIKNLLRQNLTDIAIHAAANTRVGSVVESQNGIMILAKVVGDVVAEMLADSLREKL